MEFAPIANSGSTELTNHPVNAPPKDTPHQLPINISSPTCTLT